MRVPLYFIFGQDHMISKLERDAYFLGVQSSRNAAKSDNFNFEDIQY